MVHVDKNNHDNWFTQEIPYVECWPTDQKACIQDAVVFLTGNVSHSTELNNE